MADDITMTEELSFMDMLQPWPHHLHVFDQGVNTCFAVCDCGWVGNLVTSKAKAAMAYRDHIERPGETVVAAP